METFSIKFKAGQQQVDALVTAFDRNTKFKVEISPDEGEPILLERSLKGIWKILLPGPEHISNEAFEGLRNAIEAHLDQHYGINNILVLTDFSDDAFNATKYAISLCQQIKTPRIILYHWYEYLPVMTTAYAPVAPLSVYPPEESIQKLQDLKNRIAHLVPEGTMIEIKSDEEPLLTAINKFAEEEQVGLVVMGTNYAHTIAIARDCSVPVLVVPSEAEFNVIEKVVFACDLKEAPTAIPVQAIKIFLYKLKARLLILNVKSEADHFDADKIRNLSDILQTWDEEKPSGYFTENEDISEGIVEFADEHQVQLMITVPKVYGFFERIFHRSVTKKLAFHTHLPLLLFKGIE